MGLEPRQYAKIQAKLRDWQLERVNGQDGYWCGGDKGLMSEDSRSFLSDL